MADVPIDIELESWSDRQHTDGEGWVCFKHQIDDCETNRLGEVFVESIYARLPTSPPFRNNKLLTSSVWLPSGTSTAYVVDGDDWK